MQEDRVALRPGHAAVAAGQAQPLALDTAIAVLVTVGAGRPDGPDLGDLQQRIGAALCGEAGLAAPLVAYDDVALWHGFRAK